MQQCALINNLRLRAGNNIITVARITAIACTHIHRWDAAHIDDTCVQAMAAILATAVAKTMATKKNAFALAIHPGYIAKANEFFVFVPARCIT